MPVPRDTFFTQLPRKRMAVAALLLGPSGELLIVKPTYRAEWLVPGGAVERDESPRAACIRETKEELGLIVQPRQLLCVDYRPADGPKTECMHMVFFGGVLQPSDLARIVTLPDEIEAYRLLPPSGALPLLDLPLRRRVAAALRALEREAAVYLEDGAEPS